jgi:F/Y-rich N-terminus
MLLDRILELEAALARQPSSPSPHSPNAQTPSQIPTAFPRSLQSTHARSAFQANLHEALVEVRSEDPSVDPLYSSRHIGPQARKRQLEETKEREEEEARDARKAQRRGKGAAASNPSKAKDPGVPPSFPPQGNPGGPPATIPGSSSHTLVTSSGKRIRIKPPSATLAEPAPPPQPPSAGQAMHRIPQFINNAGVPPATHQLSPGSPMSPLGSDAEPYRANDGDSSAPIRNGNGNNAVDTPNRMGPGSPTSVGPSAASIPSTTVQRHTKPKRLKAHTVTSKSYSIPMVPRDKNGRPILPLNVGIMTVNCLGEVCMREHFHTERYIFPVGYSVNR